MNQEELDQQKKDLEILRDMRIAYNETFGTPNGKKVLADLERCGFETGSCFVPGQPDQTAFNLGVNGMLKHIKTMMKVPDEPKTDNGQSQ